MWKIKTALLGIAIIAFGVSLFFLFPGHSAALSGINQEMSFEGKVVTNSAGINIPDGSYNVEFDIYTGCSNEPTNNTGCTSVWTEDWLVHNSQAVPFVSGTFQANLGTVNSLSNIPVADWDTYPLYLSIQIGDTNNDAGNCVGNTNFQTNCGGDGVMNPYILLTSTPYSFNSNQLGGLTSSQYAQLAASQSFTGTNTFQPTTNITSAIIQQTSTPSPTSDILDVETANNTKVIQVTGPSANNAAVVISSIGGSSGLTLQSGSGTVSFGSSTNLTASGALTLASGGTNQNLTLSSSGTGTIVAKPGSDSTAAFQIQNAAGTSTLLNVDSTDSNVTILGNNTGAIQAWQTNANSLTTGMLAKSVIANGYIYAVDDGVAGTTIDYAKINTNGSTGAFATTTAVPNPDVINAPGVVSAGGYLYIIGGQDNNTSAVLTTVYSAKENANGTLGAWTSLSSTLPAGVWDAGTTVANGYIYVVGGYNSGSQSNVYYAPYNANGTLGAWTTQTGVLPAAQSANGLSAANGYLYSVGGFGTNSTNVTYYAPLNTNGSTGTWNSTSTLPANVQNPRTVVNNGYIYALGGNTTASFWTGSGPVKSVYYAQLNANGTVGAWATSAIQLPAVNTTPGVAVSNDYIYLLGGGIAGSTYSAVYYTSGTRLQVGGSLDLVGAESGDLNDPGAGGSLTAGNTDIVGSLQVQGQASINSSLTIAGNLTDNGTVLFQPTSDSTAALQIQNSAGTNTLLNVDTTNSHIDVGTNGTPTAQLYVSGQVPNSALNTTHISGSGMNDVVVSGRYMYMAGFSDSDLYIYDVSNPASPVAIGSPLTLAGAPQGITLSGHYIYVAEYGNSAMQIVDISNPHAPTIVNGTGIAIANHANAVTVSGRYAYVANNSGVDVIDVSNPDNPVKVTSISIAGGATTAIFGAGRYVYATVTSNGTNSFMKAIDTTTNTVVGSFTLSGGSSGNIDCSSSYGPRAVYVQGRYAYVANCGNAAIDIFDVSNPTASGVTPVESLSTGSAGPYALVAQGRYVYAALNTAGNSPSYLAAYDVSTPTSAFQVGSSTATAAGSYALAVQGRYAYVDQFNASDFQIFDMGGEYTQQLEAGGIETGTLAVDSDAGITGNLSVTGGLQVGQSETVSGNFSTAGQVLVQNASNSNTAFQVQDAAGAPILLVDTTSTEANGNTLNYLSYPGFESGSFSSATAGWAPVSPATLQQNAVKANTYNGLYSAQVGTTTSNGGLTTNSFVTPPPTSTTYIVSFYAELSSGTMPSTSFTVQSTDGTTHTCSPAGGITINSTGFQRLYCQLPTTTGVMTALQITQNDSVGPRTIYIDSVQLQSTSFNGATITTPTDYQIGGIQLRGVIENPVAILPNSNSTSVFQISNATGSTLFNADTLNSVISITGAAPASVSGAAGTTPANTFSVTGATGGANTSGAFTGGNGAGLSFTSGAGGGSASTASNSNGGAITIQGGIAGTGGSGAAGSIGVINLNTSGGAINTGSGLLTLGGSVAFSGSAAQSITGPGTGGLTVGVTSGPLTLSTTTSGTLSVTSAGVLTLTGSGASTWDIGANTLSLQTTHNGAITTGTGLFTASGALTIGAGNLTFSGTTARSIVGPGTGGLTVGVTSGPLTLSTTTSGTLSVTSAGVLTLTGSGASTWDIGANTLSLQTTHNGAITTGTGLLTAAGSLQVGSGSANTNTALIENNNYDAALGTEPAEADGAMYYNSTINQFRCGVKGVWENCGGLDIANSTTASCTVSATATSCVPNNYFTSAAPSIPANYCTVGRYMHVIVTGIYTGTTATTMTLSVRLGSTIIGAASSALATGTSASMQWSVNFNITCDSTTTVTGEGTAQVYSATATQTIGQMTGTGTTTVTNTSAQSIEPYVNVGTAADVSSITIEQFIVQGM